MGIPEHEATQLLIAHAAIGQGGEDDLIAHAYRKAKFDSANAQPRKLLQAPSDDTSPHRESYLSSCRIGHWQTNFIQWRDAARYRQLRPGSQWLSLRNQK